MVRSDADNFEATIEQTKRGQVSFDESSVIRDSDSSDSELEQFEDFARRKFAEMARKYPVLEDKSSQMSKLIFNLQNESSSDDDFGDSESVQSLSCVHKAPEAKNNSPVSVRADLHRVYSINYCSLFDGPCNVNLLFFYFSTFCFSCPRVVIAFSPINCTISYPFGTRFKIVSILPISSI